MIPPEIVDYAVQEYRRWLHAADAVTIDRPPTRMPAPGGYEEYWPGSVITITIRLKPGSE